MKILIDSYSTCTQNKSGGVQVRINKIVDLLKKENITVDFFDKFKTNISEYDIIHIFMLNPENYNLIKYAKKLNKKVVISTIIPLINGWKIDFYRLINHLPIATTYKFLFESLRIADLLIVETEAEKKFIHKHYKITNDKINVIPNGIDYTLKNNNKIYDYIDKSKKYVLQVGRFDANKNQLNVIKALNDQNIDVIFIGGPQFNNSKYYEQCKKIAKNNIHFLGWVESESELLTSAYHNAELVIVPSYYETFGLVLLEAISAKKKISFSKTLPIKDYHFVDDEYLFDPKSINDIRNTVLKISELKGINYNYENAIKIFSWDEIVKKHIILYKEIVNNDKKNI